jgi:hypothetical protein
MGEEGWDVKSQSLSFPPPPVPSPLEAHPPVLLFSPTGRVTCQSRTRPSQNVGLKKSGIRAGNQPSTSSFCTMVHNGEGLGFPATGKDVAFPGSCFIYCREGQLTEGWNFMDFTQITQQLQSS